MKLREQARRLKQRKADALLRVALDIEGTILATIARKTGVLEGSIATGPLEIRQNSISVDIGVLNYPLVPPYDIFVERGVKGQTFKYHRDGQVVFEGVGQHFLSRALEANRENFFESLAHA